MWNAVIRQLSLVKIIGETPYIVRCAFITLKSSLPNRNPDTFLPNQTEAYTGMRLRGLSEKESFSA